ncbi:MAG: TPM domain-containing protein [Nitrosomonas sp.]
MNVFRISCHLMTGQFSVRRAFPTVLLDSIEQSIKSSEHRHAGEILFAVEAALDLSSLLRDKSARERAIDVFSMLRVWDTELNNGVLIYLLMADRDVEIIADRGIHAKVGQVGWERICQEMEAAFRQGQFEQGILTGIEAITQQLQIFFPPIHPSGANELPNRPVVLK